MNKEIKTDHFKTLNELLETCKMWIEEEDWYAYNRFFEMQCMEEMYEYIVKLQQENKELHNKIDKAIRYIKKNKHYIDIEDMNMYLYEDDINKVLEILKDSDVDE